MLMFVNIRRCTDLSLYYRMWAETIKLQFLSVNLCWRHAQKYFGVSLCPTVYLNELEDKLQAKSLW